MKFLVFILSTLMLLVLLSGSVTNAMEQVEAYSPYQCVGANNVVKRCLNGEVCHVISGTCYCLPNAQPPAGSVYLSYALIGVWTDGSRGGKTFSQWEVTINNNSARNILQITIGTDASFKLRDTNSLWNMVRLPNGNLQLPPYQPSINAYSSFKFGFIIEGVQAPNLPIISILFQ